MTNIAIVASHGTDSLGGILVWALFLTFPTIILLPAVLGLIAFVLQQSWGLRRTGIMILPAVATMIVVSPLLVALGPEPDWDKGWPQAVFPNLATISLSLLAYAMSVGYANRHGTDQQEHIT